MNSFISVKGHTVLGVEGVPFVVEQFFRENKLEHDKVSMPELNGWRFRVSFLKDNTGTAKIFQMIS